MRSEFFGAELFADPAWDMLLELYALACETRRVSVSKLSLAAGVPTTTALRWIEKLEAEGLVVRANDPLDARRVWVALSNAGHSAMQAFVEEVTGRDAGR
ncbi:winged helix DNA-binding protein [Sphingomonas sp. URHD0057]|uniref:winged helix DNA-binding protein n=1 Tax=Sphingomonas sp. URHD0057 TaxID=1380389 RepID=UPI000ACB6EBC|nr:winged helix DNA-binding protein [Sphingomonas sp. URHD0057]